VIRGHWVAYVSNKKKLDGASARCGIEGFQAQPREGKRDTEGWKKGQLREEGTSLSEGTRDITDIDG